MILSIKALSVKFKGLIAVNNFSMDVEKESFHSLIGPNGAGKTTVVNALTRVVPSTGTAFFEGFDLLKMPPHRIINVGVARTFQNLELFKNLTVMANLFIGTIHKINYNFLDEVFNTRSYKSEQSKTLQSIIEIAEMLGIKRYLNMPVSSLPYGTQKLVEIGRAVISRPKLLILDEPFAGLNDQESEKLKEEILRIKGLYAITILMIEHDMKIVMSVSNKITVMNFGEKIAEGSPSEIIQNRKVAEAYLGDRSYFRS
ncbi:ABC transporter ATP-binding protein [Athalassotoga saccharophila]|uniref:ABC transporter ATP-binding protein n=1 Tax=Athalassotoga saccharophila TaxID=1441386 RepID=UPI00137AF217|nr:ABC transporter ATP-binding protein [Athalassotoga saccharophila]BBJ28115.1 branched-chain amino acid transport ATP-binding protein LivG [Athalassotoga saccharophila]